MTAHVAVLVPGIAGSVLMRGKQVIWPDLFTNLVNPKQAVKDLLDPSLKPTDVIRSYAPLTLYQDLIDHLGRWGFRENATPPTLRLVPYDWRKTYSKAAERISQAIDTTVAAHNDDCTVSIIAHSMGGLAGRYYLESGDFDTKPGFRKVRKLITLGTPHRGAPHALTVALGRERVLFLDGKYVARVANHPNYPAVYEGFPPRNEPFIWDQKTTAALEPIILDDDPVLTKALGLSNKNLKAAREFQAKLDFDRRPKDVRYFCFVGSRQSTVCAVWLLKGPSRVEPLQEKDSGDGVTPIWSAGLPGVQSRPVGGSHMTIFKTAELLSTLAILLGYTGHALFAAPGTVEIAVRDHVVNPGDPFPFLVTLPRDTEELAGELRVERTADEGRTFTPMTRMTQPITYIGAKAESFSLSMTAPDTTGRYRLAFYDQGGALLGTDEFFVQAPVSEF